jgi:hypothetical protein
MLPNPIIFRKPLQVWLGVLAFIVLIVQILVGAQILKIPFWWHTKVLWIVLLVLTIVHGIYSFQRYFFRKKPQPIASNPNTPNPNQL